MEAVIRPKTPKSERGTVQNAILALLAERPRHGYELRGLFEQLTEAISDLIRRWPETGSVLRPPAPGDQEAGKRFAGEWLEKHLEFEQDLQQTE